MADPESDLAAAAAADADSGESSGGGWQKVVYPKRHRKAASRPLPDPDRGFPGQSPDVFRSVEQHAEDRRRRAAEARRAVEEADAAARVRAVVGEDEESEAEEGVAAGVEDAGVKKVKPKKVKKPKITVAEAAAKIDAADLVAYLADIAVDSYEGQQHIQLMRFADYFARAFSAVGAAQFPWLKILKESPVEKIVDVPLCYISEDVYKASTDWLSQRNVDALGSFVLWALESILDVTNSGTNKGLKKPSQQSSLKAQVEIFVVLAMVLRRKPDVLTNQLSSLRDKLIHRAQDNLSVFVWMITQASQGDLALGMYAWVHALLPLVSGKSNCNPQIRDLILQLVERLLSAPKCRPILLNSAVRKGERLVPPSSLELLMRVAFPASSARIKATERFEAVYPILKEVALAGPSGSKAVKQVSQQLFVASLKAMNEGNPELNKEAADIFMWCLAQNVDCYKYWVQHYSENIEASAVGLRTLCEEWKPRAAQLAPYDLLRQTVQHMKQENEKALSGDIEANKRALLREMNKNCSIVLKRVSRGLSCVKSGLFVLTVAVAAGALMLSPSMESWNLKNLYVTFSSVLPA